MAQHRLSRWSLLHHSDKLYLLWHLLSIGHFLVDLEWSKNTHCLRSHLGFFYYSKVKFTIVSVFFSVSGFSHFTMVNARLVCRVGNGGRIKAKFTIENRPESRSSITSLSKLCFYSWQLVSFLDMQRLRLRYVSAFRRDLGFVGNWPITIKQTCQTTIRLPQGNF